jgi:hypothetical protein
MSSVWVTVPSKRPAAEVEKWAQAWRDMGYMVAIAVDPGESSTLYRFVDVVLTHIAGYPGYARATNALIHYVNAHWLGRWFVIGGDDVFPDTTKRADEIAQECEQHFHMVHSHLPSEYRPGDTFGCMQCTGDTWGDKQGPYIERVAGSAWIGREFALRAYGGNGPLWPEYFHMYPDEELQLVAQKLGVFWQRPDLTQIHQHWGRPKEGETMGHSHNMPKFLKRANSDKEWDAAKKLFETRKAAGFPGHEVKA